jgi:LptD protein
LKLSIYILLILFIPLIASSQRDTLLNKKKLNFSLDSLNESTTTDSIDATVLYSKDGLDAIVDYGADDSLIFNSVENHVYLYKNAFVNYTKLKLIADYIDIDLSKNIAIATGLKDSAGIEKGLPNFDDGEQKFVAHKMRYNFKTKQGKVYDVTTKQNDLFVLSKEMKFVDKGLEDSTQKDQILYGKGAIFTTCDDPHPHYGVRSAKQKIIANKMIVVGPSNIMIGDVPTPIWLPFGFFPIKKLATKGLILPRDYENSPQLGFGLRNVGYYFPINDNLDAKVIGDIYFNGSWAAGVETRFKKIYQYDGNARFAYSKQLIENEFATKTPRTSIQLVLNYTQDSKANPYSTISAGINIQTNSFNSRVNNDYRSVSQNTFYSNASYQRRFQDKPYSLSVGMSSNVNSESRTADISFPNADFNMQQIFPFQLKKRIGDERWFEKLTFRYQANLQNAATVPDSLLFSAEVIRKSRFGIRHTSGISVPFRVFKYFNLSANVNYNENWYVKAQNRTFDATNNLIRVDTIWNINRSEYKLDSVITRYGKADTLLKSGFFRSPTMDASISLNTRIFATLQFKKGFLRGLRYTMNPSLSLNFSPDYLAESGYFGGNWKKIKTDSRPQFNEGYYNVFDGNIQGYQPQSGKVMGIGFGLNNIIEGKYFSKRDSSFKKFKIFDNITLGSSYNIVADSFKLSPFSGGGVTRIFNGLSNLQLQFELNPYRLNQDNTLNKEYLYNSTGKLVRLSNLEIRLNTGITVKELIRSLRGKKEENISPTPSNTKQESDKLDEFINAFRFYHNVVFSFKNLYDKDTFYTSTHAISTQGTLQLSRNWRVSVRQIGYDFISEQITYPDFEFYRNLHCWEFGMNWQPQRNTFSVFLRVKVGSTLDFIQIPYGRNNIDSQRFR